MLIDFQNKKLKKVSDIGPNFYKVSDIGSIILSNNELTNLEGLPEIIRGSLSLRSNKITSLKGMPKKVIGGIYLGNNFLTDLEFSPNRIESSFHLNNNKLISLKGCPEHLEEILNLDNNLTLKKLDFLPLRCGHLTFVNSPINDLSKTINVEFINEYPFTIECSLRRGMALLPLIKQSTKFIIASNVDNNSVTSIINNYSKTLSKENVLDCQLKLMDLNYYDFARWIP